MDEDYSVDTAWGGFSLGNDAAEAAQMQPFTAATTVAADGIATPWWQQVISYGMVRAIDNRFGPVNVAGNTQPGTFAGQNGRTYGQAPNASGQPVQAAASNNGGLLIIALGALAFAAMS